MRSAEEEPGGGERGAGSALPLEDKSGLLTLVADIFLIKRKMGWWGRWKERKESLILDWLALSYKQQEVLKLLPEQEVLHSSVSERRGL